MTSYINALAPYAATAVSAALTSAAYLGRGSTAGKVAGFAALVTISKIAFDALSEVVNHRKVTVWTNNLADQSFFNNATVLATPVAVNLAVNKAAPYLPGFASGMLGRDWKTALVGVLVANAAAVLVSTNPLTTKAVAWWSSKSTAAGE